MHVLTSKERLVRQTLGQEIDRIPSLGGWIGGARNLAALAEISLDQYLADPVRGVIAAHQRLGVDGMVPPVIPTSAEQIRTGLVLEEGFAGIEPEALEARAAAIPDSEKEFLAAFDPAREERRYRDHFEGAFRDWGSIVPIPNFWELGGPFPLYQEFGYGAFFMACVLYPDAVEKIWWSKALVARECAKILCGLYGEYDLVPLLFCGEDLCNNKGPMVSTDFLRERYLPLVRMIVEPLVDSGIRLIHHCDGDVRPLVSDFIRIGFSGLQGFQYELGVDPGTYAGVKGPFGQELLFFTGMSITRTLPFGTVDDVRREVEYFVEFTGGGRGMFLFTTNVTGVEVPSQNLSAGYEHLQTIRPDFSQPRGGGSWPWGVTHPDG